MEDLALKTEIQDDEFLDPEFMRKIERLSLIARKVFPGRMKGERRSTKRGSSVEFADYRDYTHGDDFRRVDWNVFARLDKLFLKLFVEEEDLFVYILIDASRSMDFGSPKKLTYAKKIAAALSYIALNNLDRAGISALHGGTASTLTPKRGKQSSSTIFRYLSTVTASDATNLTASIRDFSLKTSNPGLAIVITDCMDTGYKQGLSALMSRKFEVILLHLLDEDEVEPSVTGDLLMIDSETGEQREVTVTQTLLRRYRQRFTEFCADIERFCSRYGCGYMRITNKTPFEELILKYLRQRGLLE